MVLAWFCDGFFMGGYMSRKLLVFCFLLAWGSLGGLATAQVNEGPAEGANDKAGASKTHVRTSIPLQRAKDVLNRNEQAHPQSQGLENAIEHVNANQERFIEKHVNEPSVSDRADGAGPDIPRGPHGVDRPDHSRKGR